MRCGTLGTSEHVTAKSSIYDWGVLNKFGAYAWNALCLTPGDLQRVPQGLRGSRGFLTALQKSADIVGVLQVRLVMHSRAERRSKQIGHAVKRAHEGPNG